MTNSSALGTTRLARRAAERSTSATARGGARERGLRRALAAIPLLALLGASAPGCMGGGGGGSSGAGTGGLGAAAAGGGQSAAASQPVAPSAGPEVVLDDGAHTGLVSPYPDDRFTVADPSAATGKRVALPIAPMTDLERRFVDELSRLDGFGVFAPISVGFAADLDVASITDAAALVVNVDPGSPRFGEVAALDLGRGSYPTDLGSHRSFYARDPMAGRGDVVFPSGNPGNQYEAASRTLVLRPLRPLAEGALHAVVLTERLRGAGGDAVTPPAGYARPTAHDGALAPALAGHGLSLGAIRYQWTFTTGRPTAELCAIADGLDGQGPLAALAAQVPPRLERFDDLGHGLFDGSRVTLDAGDLAGIIGCVNELVGFASFIHPRIDDVAQLLRVADLSCLDYVAFGSIIAPDLRVSLDGTFEVDLAQGMVQVQPGRVTFLVAVPRPCAENGYAQPPYPAIVFGHGNGGSRLHALGIVAAAARHGYAVIAPDAVGHGPEDGLSMLPGMLKDVARDVWVGVALRPALLALAGALRASVNPFDSLNKQIDSLFQTGLLRPFFDGRAEDTTGDGIPDSGGNFFTADVFQTRDIVRQTVVDQMALVRVYRGFGVDRDGNGRLDPAEGDLDGDGVLDCGGAGVTYSVSGISLGGILGSVTLAADPTIARASLMVPGGGLADIVANSSLGMVTGRVFRDVFRPAMAGHPQGGGITSVEVVGAGTAGSLPAVVGGQVEATNLRTGQVGVAAVAADGGFVVHVGADQGDAIELRSLDGAQQTLGTLTVSAPSNGLGIGRASPRLRAWMSLAAHGIEAADPVVFAPLWASPPPGRAAKQVLVQISLGDDTVPVSAGAALARAAGLISPQRNDLLIATGVLLSQASAQGNVDRLHGVESQSGRAVRFLGVNAHAGMLVPNQASLYDGARYTLAAQEQALRFLRTGQVEDRFPIFDLVLPPG